MNRIGVLTAMAHVGGANILSLQLNLPPGVRAGDTLVGMAEAAGGTPGAMTWPAGWTVRVASEGTSTFNVAEKLATASEPASYTVTWLIPAITTASVLIVYRTAALPLFIPTTCTVPPGVCSVATLENDNWLTFFMFVGSSIGEIVLTPPDGTVIQATQRIDGIGPQAGILWRVWVADRQVPAGTYAEAAILTPVPGEHRAAKVIVDTTSHSEGGKAKKMGGSGIGLPFVRPRAP